MEVNIKTILVFIWDALTTIWEIITEIIFPIASTFLGFILVIGIPLTIIVESYKYLTSGKLVTDIEPITSSASEIAVKTPDYINNTFSDFNDFITQLISQYPFSILIVFLLGIFLLVKLVLKRKDSFNIQRTILIFAVLSYLIYILSTFNNKDYESVSTFFSFLLQKLILFINPNYPDEINIKIGRIEVLALTYLLTAYWINSRLLWVLSIATAQIILFDLYFDNLRVFFDTINSSYYRLLQGVIPLIIAAPYVLTVWIFRDNDKFSQFHQKERELTLRYKETRMKERDLIKKESEIDIKRQELILKEKEISLKEKEISFKEKEFELKKA